MGEANLSTMGKSEIVDLRSGRDESGEPIASIDHAER